MAQSHVTAQDSASQSKHGIHEQVIKSASKGRDQKALYSMAQCLKKTQPYL